MDNFLFVGGYGSSNGLSPEVAKMASLTASTYNGRLCQMSVIIFTLCTVMKVLSVYHGV